VKIGAHYLDGGKCEFVVWSPFAKKVELKIFTSSEKIVPTDKDTDGYWKISMENVPPDARYSYILDGKNERPDPASHFQPEGVHKPSQIVNHNLFEWKDKNWNGIILSDMIIYELHIGTFTPDGTFESAISVLDELKDLGVNAVEMMPVAQFPGDRNWGYDGAYPYAVQNSYGGPEGLKKFVNECHLRKMSVILDVVYNHLGPEGNYLADFGPYFTDKYKTPWGKAINYDDAYSRDVRNFFTENAIHWFENYHIDALRLDAVHGIFDMSAKHILQELAEKTEEFSNLKKRKFYLIAESDLNDSRVIRDRNTGGYGIDAQWCDDFHHCIHTLLTSESQGYYADFGNIGQFVKSLDEGYVYSGQHSVYRKRNHGNYSGDIPADKFVVFSQNHDQIGNRLSGDRLSATVSFEGLKLAAGCVILSPYIPLLFMGEEYAEESPFLYFVSHSDKDLIEAVRKGRAEEFNSFNWGGKIPDPESSETFEKSKINREKRNGGKYKVMLEFYKQLLKLRKAIPALTDPDRKLTKVEIADGKKLVLLKKGRSENMIICVFNFSDKDTTFTTEEVSSGWKKLIDSSDEKWSGPGSSSPENIKGKTTLTVKPMSFILYGKGKT